MSDLPPFQACVLVLSGEPAGPYFLPLAIGLAALDLPRMQQAIDAFEPRNVLFPAARGRHFWRAMHRAVQLPESPGTCSFSIVLGLQ